MDRLIYGGNDIYDTEEKKEVVSMARQHVGTSQSGMKAEKRARAACPHATVTHTDTRQNPPLNSTIKHGNGACVLHTTSV
jgi:hypothetical protein